MRWDWIDKKRKEKKKLDVGRIRVCLFVYFSFGLASQNLFFLCLSIYLFIRVSYPPFC